MAISTIYQQYLDVKNLHPNKIVMFNIGDFYEMYAGDALKVSQDLNIALVSRYVGMEENVPMCAVPKRSLEQYTKQLVDSGNAIAVAERATGEVDSIEVITPIDYREPKAEKTVLNSLSHPRQVLVEKVLKELEQGNSLWQKGWTVDVPFNPITGTRYKGINSFIISMDQVFNNRTDPRYCTFNQARQKEWKIKQGSKGIPIEFFQFINKETKKELKIGEFEVETAGMSKEDKRQWWIDNVRTNQRQYHVFSANDIDGIPPYEAKTMSVEERERHNQELDNLINKWQAPITYGGSSAYYDVTKDGIVLPNREQFKDNYQFYATALHEIGHSTGHSSRLNRDLSDIVDKEKYAIEELRAEIGSMFLGQTYKLPLNEDHIENHSAYIKSWHKALSKNPSELFSAIKDADKLAKYVEEYHKSLEQSFEMQNENNMTVIELKGDKMENYESNKNIAKLIVQNSVRKVINNDLDYVDAAYADTMSDKIFDERTKQQKIVGDGLANMNAKEVEPFMKELVQEYTDKIYSSILENYGYSKDNFRDGIVRNIEDEYLRTAMLPSTKLEQFTNQQSVDQEENLEDRYAKSKEDFAKYFDEQDSIKNSINNPIEKMNYLTFEKNSVIGEYGDETMIAMPKESQCNEFVFYHPTELIDINDNSVLVYFEENHQFKLKNIPKTLEVDADKMGALVNCKEDVIDLINTPLLKQQQAQSAFLKQRNQVNIKPLEMGL